MDCVPLGAKKRPVPLIGARVAVKEVGRDVTARPGQIEQGIITTSSASHHPDRFAQLMRPVRDAWVPSGALRRRSSCDMTRGWLVAAPAAINTIHRPGFPSNLHQRASKLLEPR